MSEADDINSSLEREIRSIFDAAGAPPNPQPGLAQKRAHNEIDDGDDSLLAKSLGTLTSKRPRMEGETSGALSISGKTNGKKSSAIEDTDMKAPSSPKRCGISRKKCNICLNDVAKNRFPKLPHAHDEVDTDLHHTSDVCFKCYREHLEAEVENKSFDAVGCPQCPKMLVESEVRKLASSSTYREYLDKAAKQYMRDDEEFQACPNANCSWDDGNILACPLCKSRYCITCQVPFHDGQTCEEHQEFLRERERQQAENAKNEKESLEHVARVSRKCPGCGANLDKYIGCDHVTCSRCRHEFCWVCFAPYGGEQGIFRRGNAAHEASCRYAPRFLPNLRQQDIPRE